VHAIELSTQPLELVVASGAVASLHAGGQVP
jgi:hypothetical protein